MGKNYKIIKHWFELEDFSGKLVHSLYQNSNLSPFFEKKAIKLTFPTRSKIEENTRNWTNMFQRNFAQVIAKLKDVISQLFIRIMIKVLLINHHLKPSVQKNYISLIYKKKFDKPHL